MNNVYCINTSLPSVETRIKEVKASLSNLLNEKQIAIIWNMWIKQNPDNLDKVPTPEDIADTYAILDSTTLEEIFNKESIADKTEVLDVIQWAFFQGLSQLSGKVALTREDVAKYQGKVFEQMPDMLREAGLYVVASNFDRYKEFFTKTRLTKLQIPEVDLNVEEFKGKDTIGENSSVYSDPKQRASDEVVYLIASLESEEEAFGLPRPVNFSKTWNTITNILANSTSFDEQVSRLILSEEPFISQILEKLGIVSENDWMPEADFSAVRTSFFEGFSKQKQDIVISSYNGKDTYSAIDRQETTAFALKAKNKFYISPFSKKVNGVTVLDTEKYLALNLGKTNEDLFKFLSIFGIDLDPNTKLTADLVAEIEVVKKYVDRYIAGKKGEIDWLDNKDLDIASRIVKIIESQLDFIKKDKNLSVRNAEGKKQYASSNHNYFSKIASKLENGYKKAVNAFERLFSEKVATLTLVSGAKLDNSEASIFSKLTQSDIYNSLLGDMFSNNPVIHLPRTSDKSTERGAKIKSDELDNYLAYTEISNKVLNNLFEALQNDVKQEFSPDWDYGDSSPLSFWNAYGIDAKTTKEEFKAIILEFVASQREEVKADLIKEGIITKDTISFSNAAALKMGWETAGAAKKEDIINKLIDNYNFNSFYFGTLSTQSLYGSMAGVKVGEIYKRFAGAVAESRSTRVDVAKVEDLNKDMAEYGLTNFNAGVMKVMVHSKTIEASTDKDLLAVSNVYEKNDIDDAQGVIVLPMYKNFLDMANQWTPIQEEAYKKIMKGEVLDPKIYESVFPPIKPVGYALVNVTKDGVTYKVPVYIKTAIYPISPVDTKGLENEDKWNAGVENGIGLFIPKSGIKMATPKNLKDLYKDGEFQVGATFDFPMEFLGIQLDINAKESKRLLQSTQERKLITVDLFNNGVSDAKYIEWVQNNIDTLNKISDIETEKLYEEAGVEVNNAGIPTIVDYSKLKNLVTDELLSRDLPVNVIDSLNAVIDENGRLNGNTIDGLPARQKIMNLLNSVVTNRLIKLYTNGTSLVQISEQGWRFKNIGKNPSDAEILAIESSIEFVSDAAKIKYYRKNGLEFVKKGEKTAEAEIFIPAKYKPYIGKDGTISEELLVAIGYRTPVQAHNSMLCLKVAGFLPAHLDQMVVLPKEITSQSGSDFDVDKFNLFLPNIYKGKILDNSVDPEKEYNKMLKSNKQILSNIDELLEDRKEDIANNIKLLQVIFKDVDTENTDDFIKDEIDLILEDRGFSYEKLEKLRATTEKLVENKKEWINKFKLKQLENELIQQHLDLLTDPNIYDQMVTPNTAEPLKVKAAEITKELIKNGKEPKKIVLTLKNLFNGRTIAKMAYQMFASKALVGVFASHTTHHSLSQQVGLHFKTGRPLFFDHNFIKIGQEKFISLSGILNVVGERISNALGNNLMTASVDAAKDDYLTELGINLQTGDTTAAFTRTGGDKDFFIAWVNQPIIQAYLDAMSKNSSYVTKSKGATTNKRKVIEKILKDFGITEDLQYITEKFDYNFEKTEELLINRKGRGNYSVEELEDMWYKGTVNPQAMLDLLDDYLYFEDLSLVLRQSISTTKFDVAGPGKDILETMLLRLKFNAFNIKMEGKSGYTLGTATTKAEEVGEKKEGTETEITGNSFTYDGRTIETEFPLGAEQAAALETLIDFARDGNKSGEYRNVHTLSGAAGTGKTSIIGYLQKYLRQEGFSFAYMAPTHAATAQLAFSTVKTGNEKLPSTVASGITLNPMTGKWVFTAKVAKNLGFSPVIVVDESSMLGEEDTYKLVEASKNAGAKLVFLGDEKQIPQVEGQQNNPKGGTPIKMVAPAFTDFAKSSLTKVFRQKNNILLNTLTKIREQIKDALFKPLENTKDIKFLNTSEYNREIVKTVKEDPENTTIISYTNDSVTAHNKMAREILGRSGNTQVGDIIMGYLGYASKQIELGNLANSVAYKIKTITNEDGKIIIEAESKKLKELIKAGIKGITPTTTFEYYPLTEDESLSFDDITDENREKNNKELSAIFRNLHNATLDYNAKKISYLDYLGVIASTAKVLASKSVGNEYIYNPVKDKMEIFDSIRHKGIKSNGQGSLLFKKDVDYGHAITVHKSQGLTIDNVFFDPTSLKSVRNINIIDKNDNIITTEKQSLAYVAMSRSAKKLVVHDSGVINFEPFDATAALPEEVAPALMPAKKITAPSIPLRSAPYTRLITDTLLDVFYKKSFNFVESLYSDLIALNKNNNLRRAVEGLIFPTDETNFVTKASNSTEASLIYGTAVNYLIQNYVGLNETLMFGNNTVAHRIMAIQTDENHPLYNNGVIQDFFTIEPAPNDRMPFKLVPKDKNLSNDELNDFTSAFEEIKQFDRMLYEDLLTVALFQTGVVQSPSSFYDVLPYYDIIPKVSEAIIQQSSTTLDPEQIAERILSNIGTRLTNLKRVTFDVGFYNGGTLNLTEENAGKTQKMQFINATIMGRNEFNEPQKITSGIFKRTGDLTYVKIDPRNDGYMFQNLADSNTRQMFPPEDFFNDDYTDVEITSEEEEEEVTQSSTSIKPTIDLSREWAGDLKTRPVYTAEGVNTMRTEAAAPNEHFGNPFSEAGYGSTIKVDSIGQAVDFYKSWLIYSDLAFREKDGTEGEMYKKLAKENSRRQWILDQINQGKLDGATLLYAGKSAARGQGMHPTALAEVVEQLRGAKSPIKPPVLANLPGPETKINIYAGAGENAELSNFANRPFIYADIKFNTVEGAFQAHKFSAALPVQDNYKEVIEKLQTATGSEAKKIGQKIQNLNKETWDNNNSTIMKDVIKASFEQNPNALSKLLATGNATLTHTQESPKSKWREEFPKLLMEVREELRSTQPQAPVTEVEPKVLANNVEITKSDYTKDTAPNNPTTGFIFTENAEMLGTDKNVSMTQAIIRTTKDGLKNLNALPIITKKLQVAGGQWANTEEDFNEFKRLNKMLIQRHLSDNWSKIVFPKGFATDKAQLPTRFAEWLQKELLDNFGLVTELNAAKTGLISKSVSSQPEIKEQTIQETKEEAPWFTWNDIPLAQRKRLASKTNQEEFDSWSKDKQDKFLACNP